MNECDDCRQNTSGHCWKHPMAWSPDLGAHVVDECLAVRVVEAFTQVGWASDDGFLTERRETQAQADRYHLPVFVFQGRYTR